MATLHVETYQRLAQEGGGLHSPIPDDPLDEDQVTIQGSSTSSSAVDKSAKFVCLTGDAACHIAIGASPTATTSKRYLPANTPRFYRIRGGEKVACIEVS